MASSSILTALPLWLGLLQWPCRVWAMEQCPVRVPMPSVVVMDSGYLRLPPVAALQDTRWIWSQGTDVTVSLFVYIPVWYIHVHMYRLYNLGHDSLSVCAISTCTCTCIYVHVHSTCTCMCICVGSYTDWPIRNWLIHVHIHVHVHVTLWFNAYMYKSRMVSQTSCIIPC